MAVNLALVAGIAVGGIEKPAKESTNWLLWDEPNQMGVSVAEFRQVLQTIPEPLRSTYQDDIQRGSKLVRDLYQQKRMAAEAERLKLHEQSDAQARLAVFQRQLLSGALLEHFQNGLAQPDFDTLAREHYLSHRAEYRTPEQLSLAQIWLKTPCECERASQRTLIETVQAKLQAGESFEALAKQYSADKASGDLGGRLPVRIGRGDADPPIEAAVFALDQPGAVSGIVETKQGFYLFKLLERHPSIERDFDAVKAEISEQLKSKYLSVQVGDYAARFEAGPDATINEELLKRQAFPQ